MPSARHPSLALSVPHLLVGGLLLCGAWSAAVSAQPASPPPARDLFVAAAGLQQDDPAPRARGVRRRTLVRPRPGVLRDARGLVPERLSLTLRDDVRVVAARTRSDVIDAEATYWTGRIEGTPTGDASFVQRGPWLAGHVHIGGRTFVIQSQADGTHAVDEVDEADQPQCGGGLMPAGLAGRAVADQRVVAEPGPARGEITWPAHGPASVASAPSAAAAESSPVIDLLVVYTPAARDSAAGGAQGLRTDIDLAVAQLNTVLANSEVEGQARLLDAREVAYAESGSMRTDLDRLTSPSDVFLDEVHMLRDQLGADLVVLITDRSNEGWAGYAWLLGDINEPFAPYGFSVVLRSALWAYTLAHEVGHNLGLAHDPDNAGSPGVFPDAYGFRDPPHFRDIMSYACPGTFCPQIAHVSNPDVLHNGRPTGRAGVANGARALRQTLPVTALHRETPAPVLTSVSPATGPTLGGTRVALSGSGLASVARVTFGPGEASGLVLRSAGELSVVVPSHPQGAVDIRVESASGDASTLASAFVYQPSARDADGDALPDDWEAAMGLSTSTASGSDGAFGDPDGDGVNNLDELRTHGHPRGFHRRYFAEGAASTFFETRIARLNPQSTVAHTLVRRQFPDGSTSATWDAMPPLSRRSTSFTAGGTDSAFATVVESDVPIVVDRTMTWDAATGYGSHAERGITAPSPVWYLAEGATHSGFELFYLLQNPSATARSVRVRYLRPAGAPLEKTYLLPPTSRTDIWVNLEVFAGLGQALASTDVSAVIESLDGTPIIVERAMYLSNQGRPFNAGHASAGVTAPATEWFLAEGATGSYFDLFVLIANPTSQDAQVTVTYLLIDGTTYSRTLEVRANARANIWVDVERIPGVEGFPLADVAVSTTVTSTNGVPIIVERAMWWPGSSATWHEGHNSPGSTAAGTRWALAEGEVGGARAFETYVLIANTSAFAGQAKVTLYFEDGAAPMTTIVGLRPESRTNVPVANIIGPSVQGRRFGVIVESVGETPAQIVVERAMYSDAAGVRWAAGSNALGTRLP